MNIASLLLSIVAIVLAGAAFMKAPSTANTAGHMTGAEIVAAIDAHMATEQQAAAANLVKEYNLSRGDVSAPVQFVEFGNYKCPYCHRVQPTVDQLLEEYGDKVRHVFKHMPIDGTSFEAAKALQAAYEQDADKGWAFFGLMWDESDLTDETFVRVAEAAELDIEAFNAYRNSDEADQRVQQDIADANAIGGSGTPFFVINGEPLSGAQPFEAFAEIFNRSL